MKNLGKKRRGLLLVYCALLLIINCMVLANEGPNLVKNPGFEIIGEKNLPIDWFYEYGGKNNVETDNTVFRSGSRSVKLIRDSAPNNNLAIGQFIDVQPGADYKLTAWLKCTGITPKVSIWIFNSEGKHFQTGGFVRCELSDDFKSYSFEVTMPQEAVKVQVRVEAYLSDTIAGAFWMDDVELKRIDKLPPNPLVNLEAVPSADGKVLLSWQPPPPATDGDLPTYYNIYRYTFSNFTLKSEYLIAQGVFDNSFYDSEIEFWYPEETVCYVVTGVDWLGNESTGTATIVRAEQDKAISINLVKNGDFEEGLDKPEGFSFYPPLELDKVNYVSPGRSLKLVKSEGQASLSTQSSKIELTPGVSYKLSAKVKSQMTVGNAKLYGYIYTKDNQYLKNTPIIIVPQNTDWEEVSVEFKVDADWDYLKLVYETYGNDTKGSAWIDNLCLVQVDKIPPNQINNFTGLRNDDGTVSLSWQPPSPADDNEIASFYQVWRADNPQMQNAVLVDGYVTNNSYVDHTAAYKPDKSTLRDYYYQIIVLDRVNNPSVENPIIKMAAKEDSTPPQAPLNLKVIRKADGSVDLNWQESPVASDGDKAIAYAVYRSEEPDFLVEEANQVAIVTEPAFSDEEVRFENTIKTYYYRVSAFDNVYNESTPTAASIALGACRVSGKVIFKETGLPVEGATISIDGTEIITDQTGEFNLLVPGGSYNIRCYYPLYRKESLEKSIEAGQSLALTFEIVPDIWGPRPPTNFEANTDSGGMVILTWETPLPAEEDGDLPEHYILYRGIEPDFERAVVLAPELKVLFYHDKAVKAGENYYYRLVAVDHAGNLSEVAGPIVASPIPAPLPKLLQPLNNEPVIIGSAKLEWEELAGVKEYLVEISQSKEFPNDKTLVFRTENAYLPISKVNGVNEIGTWFWRIKVYYENDIISGFTQPREFVALRPQNKLAIPYVSCFPEVFYLSGSEEELTISFVLGAHASTTIELFNTEGDKLVLEREESRIAGENRYICTKEMLSSLRSGLYYVSITATDSISKVRTVGRVLIFR